MKVLVIGAGAVGVYFSSRLAQTGAEVSVVVRNNGDEIREQGYTIESYLGDYSFMPKGVYSKASDYPEAADLIIVATKVLPTVNLVELLSGAVASQTTILMIQNGINIENEVASAFPNNPLYHAVAYIGTHRATPTLIKHEGAGNLTFGSNDGVISELAEELVALWSSVQVDAKVVDNIRFFRWKKLLWNTPYNSVSVLGCSLNTQDMSDGAANELLCRMIMNEVALVANAEGFADINEALIEENIEFTRNFPPYKTSMLVDYESGRPLEIDAFVGNVLKIAKKFNLSIPRIEMIDTLLRALTRDRMGK